MKNILAVFIITLTVLSVTVPLNTVHAQVEVIVDGPDPIFDDDIVVIILLIGIVGMLLVIMLTTVIIGIRFGRLGPHFYKSEE